MTLARREFCLAALAQSIRAAEELRFAICSETFQGLSFSEACRSAKAAGYRGLEIAPFSLAEDPGTLTRSALAGFRRTLSDEGLEFAGLHALLSAPAGLHVTTSDTAVRRRSWELLRRLIGVCASLGDRGVMVFGSGKQRSVLRGDSPADALARFRDGLASLAPEAKAHGVTVLVEPLAPHLSNLVNTVGEAVAVAESIASPAVSAMFDTHNAAAEKGPHEEVVRRYLPWIRHVHLNEMDGKRPGAGSYNFRPVLETLQQVRFPYWVSVEVFDFSEGGTTIARESLRFLKGQMR